MAWTGWRRLSTGSNSGHVIGRPTGDGWAENPRTQPSGSRSSTASSGQGCVFVCARNQERLESATTGSTRSWPQAGNGPRALLEKRLQEEHGSRNGFANHLENTRSALDGARYSGLERSKFKPHHGYDPEEGWACPTRRPGGSSLTNERPRSCKRAWPTPPPWSDPTPKPKSRRRSGEHRSVTLPFISACRNSDPKTQKLVLPTPVPASLPS